MRVFSGISVPEKVRNEISIILDNLSSTNRDFKWVSKDNLHITLQFYGEKNPIEVEEIKKTLEKTSKEFLPFNVSLTTLGAFPSLKHPRVAFLDIEDRESAENLKKINNFLSRDLRRKNISFDEREYIPHFTIGRSKKEGRTIPLPDIEPVMIKFEVLFLVLFESILKPTGPVYTIIGEYSLNKLKERKEQ